MKYKPIRSLLMLVNKRLNKTEKNSSESSSASLSATFRSYKESDCSGRILFSPIKGVSNIKVDFLNNFHFPVEVLCSSKVPSMPILTRNLFLRLFQMSSHHTIPSILFWITFCWKPLDLN